MLSGEIPSCLSDLYLEVGGNQLSGKIPQWFTADEYGSLRILRLRGNNFSGIIPRQICSLSHLQLLDLATGFWGVVGSLVLKRSWRHAEAAYDLVYVIVALRMAKINKT